MNKSIVSSVLALSLVVVLSVVSAPAQFARRMTVTIPFAFEIGESSFPSGEYAMTDTQNAGLWLIRNPQVGKGEFFSTVAVRSSGKFGNASISFRRYADKYFLAEVFDGIDSDSRKLPVSRHEKDFLGAASQTAQGSPQPDLIVLEAH